MEFEEIKIYLEQFSMEHVLAVLELEQGYNIDELVDEVVKRLEGDRDFLDNFNPDSQ